MSTRKRLGRIEKVLTQIPPQVIAWDALATSTGAGFVAFVASLPEPFVPPAPHDLVEERIAALERHTSAPE